MYAGCVTLLQPVRGCVHSFGMQLSLGFVFSDYVIARL